jgi:NAD(P)-dependent dehydrogenase (short-subunit alcohol dehydrogenase family)
MTDEDWYKVLAVNLSGAFFMSQAALEHMIERGTGRIVNISSIVGQIGCRDRRRRIPLPSSRDLPPGF